MFEREEQRNLAQCLVTVVDLKSGQQVTAALTVD